MKPKMNWDAFWCTIATLALGSRPRQRLVRLRAKRGSLGMKANVRE